MVSGGAEGFPAAILARGWYRGTVDRSKLLVRKTTLGALDDAFDRAVWARTTPAERLVDTWRLSEEIWRLKGWDPGEPGLSRHITRVVRG